MLRFDRIVSVPRGRFTSGLKGLFLVIKGIENLRTGGRTERK